MAQTSNSCAVVAQILPAGADSVVAPGTLLEFTNNSVNATSVQWLLNGVAFGPTTDTFRYQANVGYHIIGLVAQNGFCTDTATVVYFVPGIAHDIDSLMTASYGTSRYNEEGLCIDKTSDSGFIAGGAQYPWDFCGEVGIIVKSRNKGCIDWSKKFESPYFCNTSKVTAITAGSDSAYYAVVEKTEIAKLENDGSLNWIKGYFINDQNALPHPLIYSGSKKEIYTVTSLNSNGWSITRLDRNGDVTWNKYFQLSYDIGSGPGPTEYAFPSSIIQLQDKIYVAGNAYSLANNTYFSFITKIDANSGIRDWQYGYTDPLFPGAVGFVHLALYDTLLMASSGAQGHIVTLIDQQGVVRKSIKTKFQTSYGPKVTRAGADKNGHIYMMQWTEEALNLQPYYWYATNFAEIDTSMNKYWGLVQAEYFRSYNSDAVMGVDGKFQVLGTKYGYVGDGVYASRDFHVLKVDTVTNNLQCLQTDTSFLIYPEPINRLNFQYQVDSSLTIVPRIGTDFKLKDAYVQSRYTCPDFIDSCSFMKLTGPANLCNLNQVYTYRLHRNKKCTLLPHWDLPSGVTIVNQTDSSISIRYPNFGVYRIYVTLQSCIPVMDSLVATLVSKTHPLNIGADTTICAGTSIQLNASKDFLGYRWSTGSNGSTDSLLTVTQPGLYWVEVTDSCYNTIRDSILIQPFYFAMDIGPDRLKCKEDTIQLKAPSGFLNYQWSNNYNINALNTQNVVVNPTVDTAYYCKAEKLPGCFSFDTVRIRIYPTPVVALGNDISFCAGDSAQLNAGAGFAQYLWTGGSTQPMLTVRAVGSYSVVATTAQGCKATDTVDVVQVFTNPNVNLDANPYLCTGTTRTLQAGSFANYLWQDGSRLATYTVRQPGTYYVTVTDNNLCKGTDTVRIISFKPLPQNFLPADMAICNYGDNRLMANQSFTNYLWNTGETGSSLKISLPGTYWLR
ncbi:MAG: hypothetical protein RLY16_425, partial [Bacteroidota bacterium]